MKEIYSLSGFQQGDFYVLSNKIVLNETIRKKDFSEFYVRHVNFSNCIFDCTSFPTTNCEDLTFQNCQLMRVDLGRSYLMDFDFINCKLNRVLFNAGELINLKIYMVKKSMESQSQKLKKLQNQLEILIHEINKLKQNPPYLIISSTQLSKKAKKHVRFTSLDLKFYELAISKTYSLQNSRSRFRGSRLRIGLMLMAMMGLKITQLLSIKVKNVKPLFESDDYQNFFTSRGVEVIQDRKKDFDILNTAKKSEGYIFAAATSDKPLRRKVLSRIINQVLKDICQDTNELTLTTAMFQSGFIEQLWIDFRDIEFVQRKLFSLPSTQPGSSGSGMAPSPKRSPSPPADRIVPKLVDGPGNPGNGVDPAEFDDSCPADEAEKTQKLKTEIESQQFTATGYVQNQPRKINERFETRPVQRSVKRALRNDRVQAEYQLIKKRLEEGVELKNISKHIRLIGVKPFSSNTLILKGFEGWYLLEPFHDHIDILQIGTHIDFPQ